jgi:hypothetical protein
MSDVAAPLEIHVHLVDGSIIGFQQPDPELAKQIIASTRPEKLFSQPQLRLAGEAYATLFPMAAVARLDFIGEELAGWGDGRELSHMEQITKEEFEQHRLDAGPRPPREGQEPPGDEPLILYREIVLTNGERVYSAAHLSPPREHAADGPRAAAIDLSMMIRHELDGPALGCRRAGGGVILINPHNVLRLTVHPGPPEVAPGSWAAEWVQG